MIDKYPLKNKLVLINAGKMQQKISCFEAVIQAGGNPILLVSDIDKFSEEIREIDKQYSSNTFVSSIDITSQQDIDGLKNALLKLILLNNLLFFCFYC